LATAARQHPFTFLMQHEIVPTDIKGKPAATVMALRQETFGQ
jgi:hypothetical protein